MAAPAEKGHETYLEPLGYLAGLAGAFGISHSSLHERLVKYRWYSWLNVSLPMWRCFFLLLLVDYAATARHHTHRGAANERDAAR